MNIIVLRIKIKVLVIMTTKIAIIETGGTFSMGSGKHDLAPVYQVRHFILAREIFNSLDLQDDDKRKLIDKLNDNKGESFTYVLQEFNNKTGNKADLFAKSSIDSKILRPYFIDSINFQFDIHYSQLKNSILEALQNTGAIIVIGGTDTVEFYATAIALDVDIKNAIKNKKILFINSMRSFGNDPKYVTKIFDNSIGFINSKEIAEGVFVFSVVDRDVSKIDVHDVTNNFVKITSYSDNAFRSNYKFGSMIDGKFVANTCFKTRPICYQAENLSKNANFLKIAPPLLADNDPETVIDYLNVNIDYDVIIEWSMRLSDADPQQHERICKAIQEKKAQGQYTYIVNNYRYNVGKGSFEYQMDTEQFNSSIIEKLRLAGGCIVNKQEKGIKDVFLEASFRVRELGQEKISDTKECNIGNILGLYYVPRSDFSRFLIEGQNIVISLAGGAIPRSVIEQCVENKNRELMLVKQYDTESYTGNPYQAGREAEKYMNNNIEAQELLKKGNLHGLTIDKAKPKEFTTSDSVAQTITNRHSSTEETPESHSSQAQAKDLSDQNTEPRIL